MFRPDAYVARTLFLEYDSPMRTQARKQSVAKLIDHVNRKDWWHVPPRDPEAYKKRGKFYAATFREAEFYGRPLDAPERVTVSNPLVGDEREISNVLKLPPQQAGMSLTQIAEHDAKWRDAALALGYDSIILMATKGFANFNRLGKLPRSIELNVLRPSPAGSKSIGSEILSGVTGRYGSILIDPPWRFNNRTGKVGPEHRRLHRYGTLSFDEIARLPVPELALPASHLYLWCPNALLLEALNIMKGWGFTYKTNIVWYKVRKDGGPDGRGVGFYFRNVTELVLFGIRGRVRTLAPGRSQVNIIVTRKQEHSRKPDELYEIIERCSPGPHLELFARNHRKGWTQWGDELGSYEPPPYRAYVHSAPDHSASTQLQARGSRQDRLHAG